MIVRATSAPNTFTFTELLQAPQIQAFASSSDELAPYLALLNIFSYGTYASLKDVPNLPPLNDAQALKLRQLSLLSHAQDSNRNNGDGVSPSSYSTLLHHLSLSEARELEELVISTIYAGLIDAKLDPKNELVRINSVAALRDVAPGTDTHSDAIGNLLSNLQAWAGRCEATLLSLEAQMSKLRADADFRAAQAAAWSDRMEKLVEEEQKGGNASGNHGGKSMLTVGAGSSSFSNSTGGAGAGAASGLGSAAAAVAGSISSTVAGTMNMLRQGKRGSGQMDASGSSDNDDEAMDLDDDDVESTEGKKRASRRKLQQG